MRTTIYPDRKHQHSLDRFACTGVMIKTILGTDIGLAVLPITGLAELLKPADFHRFFLLILRSLKLFYFARFLTILMVLIIKRYES